MRNVISVCSSIELALTRIAGSVFALSVPISEYHEQYKAALQLLFNTYKSTFAPHRKLLFVGDPSSKPVSPANPPSATSAAVPAGLPPTPPRPVAMEPIDTKGDAGEEVAASTLTKRR
jgi:hypothetical protein